MSIEDDWPHPGFDNSADPANFQTEIPDSSSSEENLALGQEEPFYRRKTRIIWFREGVDGIEKGWEDLEYSAENLADFATAFETVYYSTYGVFGDTEHQDFYYLRQGDVIVGTDSNGLEIVALVGEVEPNVRGKIQKPVPDGKYSFSINMEKEGMPSSHVLTFLTQTEGCRGPCEGSDQFPLGYSDTWSQDSPPSDYCGVVFSVLTDIDLSPAPYGGHLLTLKKRQITLNDCGDVVHIGEEVDEDLDLSHLHDS
jgi:hypothetical protein